MDTFNTTRVVKPVEPELPKVTEDAGEMEWTQAPRKVVIRRKRAAKAAKRTVLKKRTIVREDLDDFLLPVQKAHISNLVSILKEHSIALDTSETGAGKTYFALGVAKALGYKVLVIAPTICNLRWREEAERFGVELYSATTLSALCSAKGAKWHNASGNLVPTDIIKRSVIKVARRNDPSKSTNHVHFTWNAKGKLLVVNDEMHNMHKTTSLASHAITNYTLGVCAEYKGRPNAPMFLGLSATSATSKASHLPALVRMLGVSDVCDDNILKVEKGEVPLDSARSAYLEAITAFCSTLDVKRELARKRIADQTGTPFEEVEDVDVIEPIFKVQYVSDSAKTHEAYKDMYQKNVGNSPVLYSQWKDIDMLKVQDTVDLAVDRFSEGDSVIVFCTNVSTVLAVVGCKPCEHCTNEKHCDACALKYGASKDGWCPTPEESCDGCGLLAEDDIHLDSTLAVLTGKKRIGRRHADFRNFNEGKIRIIVATVSCGGTGVNLHDTSENGEYPRSLIVTPTIKARLLVQAMGRIDRPGQTSVPKIFLLASDCELGSFTEKMTQKELTKAIEHTSLPAAYVLRTQ